MANRRWIGASLNRRQVDLITMSGTGDWVQGDTITLTVDNVDFIVTIGTLVTDAQVATTVYQALTGTTLTDTSASCTIAIADGGGASIPQFSEFTATNGTSGVVTLTSNGSGFLAGKPFTITATENSTGDDTAARSASVTPTSQCHADQADNWSGNTPPEDSDTLTFDNGSVDVRWGLTTYASGSTTSNPTTIIKYKSYTGNVGLPEVNTDNSAKPYHEYRTTYFTTDNGATANCDANLEVGEGPGSGRFKWDAGSGQTTLSIFGKGSRIENGVPCILWKGSHASNVVYNLAGDLGIAFFGGETATVATLVTGDGPTSQASTICGSGVTLTTVTLNGGSQETNSAITTATQNAGTWVHKSGTITTLTVRGGTFYPNGAATITTLNVASGGTFDASKGNASFTITNTIQLYKGSKFLDPQGRTGNPVFKLNQCQLADVTVVLPPNKTFTPS